MAYYKQDGGWYRASVNCVNEQSQSVEVRFVDFGNETTLKFARDDCDQSTSELIKLDRRHAKSSLVTAPAQALRCSLAGVKLATGVVMTASPSPSTSVAHSDAEDKSEKKTTIDDIYRELLDVRLIARVLNVRKLFTVATGGFLPPKCTTNPVVCDVLLCYADELDEKGAAYNSSNCFVDLSVRTVLL